MTDRQRWNWHAAINLQNELRRWRVLPVVQMNTMSLCDSPEERSRFVDLMREVAEIAAQVEHGRRSVTRVRFELVEGPAVNMASDVALGLNPIGPE